MRHHNVSESHRSKTQRFPDSWISITNLVNPVGAKQITLLNVLRVEGVIGAQGRIDHFYAKLGEVEQDVDILFAFFPIGNPIREKKMSMKNISRISAAKNHPDTIKIRKRDKQQIKRLLKADIWKINIKIHVVTKSSVITQSEEGEVLEILQKTHKDRVLKVIGAWNAEFRPSKLKGITPCRLSDLFPSTTDGQSFTYGDTRTINQLTKFPQRMDTTPTPAFEVPPGLPTDIVLGKAMVGHREVESVGLPLEALQNNVAIFTVDLDQRKRILTKILTQVQQYEQSRLILDTSGNYSINKPGNIILRPGINFHIAPLFTEGLSTEQYTDLFLRVLNLYCELPESRLGELAGLILTLYEDLGEQTSLQVLYQALLGEHSDDESTMSSTSFYYDTYGLRSVAALLHPLLHGLAGATVSADPKQSTIKILEALLEKGNTVIIDLSRQFTPVFKKFFITLIISKLLAFRRSKLDNGLSSKDLILVLEDIDLFLRKGDWRTNQRLDNFLPVLIELGRVNVGLITLGTTPEVLWEPAWGVFSRNLILSQLTPDAAKFIERYLDLGKKHDKTKRKFLQQLGANDIILVKRSDYVEPFLCKFEEATNEQYSIEPREVVQTFKDDQELLSQAYDLEKIFAADSKYATNVLEILEARGKPVPYLGLVTMQEPEDEGGILRQDDLKELLNRLEESGLIKFGTSRGIPAEISIEITPVGRLFLQKYRVKTHIPSLSTEIKHAPVSQGEINTTDEKTSIDLVKTSEKELEPAIEHPEFISRTRTLVKDWIAAKRQFWEEKPTSWAYMKTAIIEALSDLYVTDQHHPSKSVKELLKWIRRIPDIDDYIYPELEEALLSPGNGPFDPNVFTSDILQMYEDLFSIGSGYPRVIHRTAEIESLEKSQPIEAMKKAISLIIDLLSVIVDLDHIPPVDNFTSFLEAFSLAGAFLPNKIRLRELEAIMGQINQGDISQELAEKCVYTLENFNTDVKNLEAAIFDINEQMAAEVRRIYTQEDVPKAKISPKDLQESLIELEEEDDEVLSDLLAVGSEELVLIDCGRFIREGLGALLELNIEQINLEYSKRLLIQILNEPTLNIPFAKPAKRVLDALSFMIETGELPAEDIAKLAQKAQKFSQTMKTFNPDQTVKIQLMKLFERIREPKTEL